MRQIIRDRMIRILTSDIELTNDILHIEFDVPFDDDTTANVSEIKIYNLSDDTYERIAKGAQLTLLAGYKGDVGIILQGEIVHRRKERTGADRATILRVIDGEGTTNKKEVEKSYKENTRSSAIINDIVKTIGLKVKEIKLPDDKLQKKGYNANGIGTDIIRRLAEDCGASFYMVRGHVYIRDIRLGDNVRFTLSSDTGLIGTPELFTRTYQNTDNVDGYKVKALLQHQVTTAAILTLLSHNVSGQFRVIGGRHIATRYDFQTHFEVIAHAK